MSVFAGEAPPPKRDPRKEVTVGIDQRVRRLAMMAWGRRWDVAGGLRKASVVSDDAVRFVRVNVRMRVGRVGKRIYKGGLFI